MESNINILQTNIGMGLANIGMGLDHQSSLSRGIESMGAYFLARNPDFFRKNAEVESYIKYIKSINPDILYLSEVCGIEQRDLLLDGLEGVGYKTHVIEGFELWNMQNDSHRFLYHIMGSKGSFEHKKTFQQLTTNAIIRYLKSNNTLSGNHLGTNERVNKILDGGGSIYDIGGVEIAFIHSHAHDSTEVLSSLSGANPSLLIGDMNMTPLNVQNTIDKTHSSLRHVETERTYPFYFRNSEKGILSETISRIMARNFLSHPDQIYKQEDVQIMAQSNLGPEKNGLKTDHSVNHYTIRTTSQS